MARIPKSKFFIVSTALRFSKDGRRRGSSIFDAVIIGNVFGRTIGQHRLPMLKISPKRRKREGLRERAQEQKG